MYTEAEDMSTEMSQVSFPHTKPVTAAKAQTASNNFMFQHYISIRDVATIDLTQQHQVVRNGTHGEYIKPFTSLFTRKL